MESEKSKPRARSLRRTICINVIIHKVVSDVDIARAMALVLAHSV